MKTVIVTIDVLKMTRESTIKDTKTTRNFQKTLTSISNERITKGNDQNTTESFGRKRENF